MAQSKSELRTEVSELESKLSSIKKEKQELQQLLVNKEIINKDLQNQLRLLKDSVEVLLARDTVQVFSKPVVKVLSREQKEDSLLLVSLQERELKYSVLLKPTPSSYKAIAEKETLFDRQGCLNCIKFQTFQSLFVETAYIEYELMTTSNTFSGFYKYKYVPEFGEMQFSIKKIEGSFKKTDYGLELNINRIDGIAVAVSLEHYVEKPRKSKLTGSGLHLQHFYTKEVPLSKMDVVECR
jgi:hypothetical protein